MSTIHTIDGPTHIQDYINPNVVHDHIYFGQLWYMDYVIRDFIYLLLLDVVLDFFENSFLA